MVRVKIVDVEIESLIRADYNPRRFTIDQRVDVSLSLEKFGFAEPIIVNSNPKRKNVIIGGHLRTLVWGEMGNTTVPCLYLNLTLEEERELNVRLNRNTGEWDLEKLAAEFNREELKDWGFDEGDLNKMTFEDPDSMDIQFTGGDGDGAPPEVGEPPSTNTGTTGVPSEFKKVRFKLSKEQYEFISDRITEIQRTEHFDLVETHGNDDRLGNAIYTLIKLYSCQEDQSTHTKRNTQT